MATTGAGVFRCPSCNEFIATDASQCRFCNASVNVEEAQRLTRKQGELDDAISGARSIRIMGPMMLVFIPLTILVSLLFPVGLSAILEFMTIRWLIRYADVKAPEVKRLRWHVVLFAVLGLIAFVITGLLFLVAFLSTALRASRP